MEKLNVFVVEDNIWSYWSGASSYHNARNVARLWPMSEDLNISTSGESETFSGVFELGTSWVADSVKIVAVIQNYFKKCDNIGYVSAQKCVLPKNYDLDFPQNIKGVEQICELFPHLEKKWTDFNAGNMFWISFKTLDQYLTDELIDYLLPKFGEGKPPCNMTDKGIYPEYVCERLFTGVFCYDKMNLHVNEFTSTHRGLAATSGKINHSYFYQPKVISVSVPKNLIT